MTPFTHDRLRQGTILAVLSLSLVTNVFAGVRDEFGKLEEEMEAASKRYVAALDTWDAKKSKDAKPEDIRQPVLAKMDALADASLDSDDGAYVAVQCFVWSWMFDIDLPRLFHRFQRLAQHYPDDDRMPELLDMIPLAYPVSATPNDWTVQIEHIAESAKRKSIRLAALTSMGQVFMKSGNAVQAKATFEKIVRLAPKTDLSQRAEGLIYELEHLQVGMAAPSFTVKTLEGKDISLHSLRGKTVLLNFWATWCPKCVAEIPDLQKADKHFTGKPFVIIAVSLDDARQGVVDFVKESGFPGIHTWHEKGPDNPVSELYRAEFLPTWYLIDGNGIIRARDPFHDKLIPAIEAALQGK